MEGFAVSQEQTQTLVRAASDAVVQSDALLVLVCERSGVVLAQTPAPGPMDIDTVAVLGAGVCAATQELARRIDEPAVESVSHLGTRRSVHMQVVCGQFFVLTVFDDKTTLGLVKLYVGRMAEQVAPVLARIAAAGDTFRAPFEFRTDGDVFRPATA